MKLTWFGGTTVRIYIGGKIVVLDAAAAPAGIDAAELVAGADVAVSDFGAGLASLDTATWRPQKPGRLLDEAAALPPVRCWAAGEDAVLLESLGESPLLLVRGAVPVLGRWADDAVVVLFGDGVALSGIGRTVLAQRAPRLLALAGDEAAVELAIAQLADGLDGTGLVALETGLALEV
tara:strand:- start:3813 stop:4346 length:534 start_codon:yes stop_codon:yes gene_type:complete